jgi:hypothetical protein
MGDKTAQLIFSVALIPPVENISDDQFSPVEMGGVPRAMVNRVEGVEWTREVGHGQGNLI